jgi:GT2 family glycosyltransferase
MKKIKLSIVILNYNTKELLESCLNSIKACMDEVELEVIVSDNSSSDGSSEMVREKFPWVKLTEGPNGGFSKGNNRTKPLVEGDLVLFLNPDTVVHRHVFAETVRYLNDHSEVGALTCKLILPNGKIDKDIRRRFPTPWISFKRLILGNGRDYWYGDVSENEILEVDVIEGAFFLTRKKILDGVGWFDEDYFFQGEDIDLCWKIKEAGWKIIYYPKVAIDHLKGSSTGKNKLWQPKITFEHKMKVKLATVEAMEIFFRKRLWSKYPVWFDYFVLLGINLYKLIRLVKVGLTSKLV